MAPSQTREHNREDIIQKLAELIADTRVAMFTTRAADGTLRSRPMATQQAPFAGELWFFTSRSSDKSSEIGQAAEVNVAYAKPDDQSYVSVSGRAHLVDDRAKARELWNPLYKAWFPQGVDDPDLRLIRIDVTGAEYWDASSSAMVHLIGFAKAVATGERYEPGDNASVRL
jgi:general stress protein 26